MKPSPFAKIQKAIAASLAQEPKKAAFLGILVLAMTGVILRMVGKDSPPEVSASASHLAPGALNTPARTVGGITQTPVDNGMEKWLSEDVPSLSRNLFAIKYDFFPQEAGAVSLQESTGDGFWEKMEKSLTARADDEKRRAILIDNLRLQAANLKLELTMVKDGSPKRALVNGKLLAEGDEIDGFRLVKIEAQRIVVEREGIQLAVVFQ